MAAQSSRPFYGEYAWAFDLLIDRPVRKECAAITAWLIERGVTPGATLLDAGCGTGRYAGELARRGYAVEGVDQSPELIQTARQSRVTAIPFHFASETCSLSLWRGTTAFSAAEFSTTSWMKTHAGLCSPRSRTPFDRKAS